MDVYLIDGTYELFRHYYAVPVRAATRRPRGRRRARRAHVAAGHDDGGRRPTSAWRPITSSSRSATQLWPGYKTGAGIEPDLLAQFPLLEDALDALGVAVWPMVEFEADDALAAAAAMAAADPRVDAC